MFAPFSLINLVLPHHPCPHTPLPSSPLPRLVWSGPFVTVATWSSIHPVWWGRLRFLEALHCARLVGSTAVVWPPQKSRHIPPLLRPPSFRIPTPDVPACHRQRQVQTQNKYPTHVVGSGSCIGQRVSRLGLWTRSHPRQRRSKHHQYGLAKIPGPRRRGRHHRPRRLRPGSVIILPQLRGLWICPLGHCSDCRPLIWRLRY